MVSFREALLAGIIATLLLWWWGWPWWAWPGAVLIAYIGMTLLVMLYGAIEGTKPLWFTRRYVRANTEMAEFDRLVEHDHAAAERVIMKTYAIMRGLARQRPKKGAATLVNTFAIQANLQLQAAARLLQVGRSDEANACAREAVKLVLGRAPYAGPAAEAETQAELILTMAQVGDFFGQRTGPANALLLEQGVVDAYRAMGAAYVIHLADSLHNLGITLSMLERSREAMDAYRKAVDIYRPHSGDPQIRALMGVSLSNLCTHQFALGDRTSAAETATEAVRVLEVSGPAYRDDLARTQKNLTTYLGALE